MLNQWRMRRQGHACRDIDRQCDMQPEYTTVYLSPDGKMFRVRRLACTMCGRQFMTARDVSLAVANPAWLIEDGDDDGVEIYEEGKLWEGC